MSVVEVLRDVIDHSIPQHSSACAAQDEEAACICGTEAVMDRAYAALDAAPAAGKESPSVNVDAIETLATILDRKHGYPGVDWNEWSVPDQDGGRYRHKALVRMAAFLLRDMAEAGLSVGASHEAGAHELDSPDGSIDVERLAEALIRAGDAMSLSSSVRDEAEMLAAEYRRLSTTPESQPTGADE